MCEYCLLTWPWLQRSGWSVQKPEVEDGTDGYLGKDGKGNDGPYKDLGINRRNGLYIEADQDKDFDNCHGKNNPASYAEFWNSYNVPGKTIVALHNYSPTVRLLEDPSAKPVGERLPDVNKWSDITFIVWANQAKAATGSLKYVFRNNVITASTRGIMNVAAHRAENPSNPNGHMDATIPFTKEWPGHKFNRGSVEFQALIGTPHGKGAAALLVDHPTEFPGKYIESITIFTMESAPQLLFTFTGPAN
ncbi:MAG: hypothetical protein LQ343_002793 [Gyalolechia ehrenbergii]|nr:MAG: hypothetical protein LQ343_002793 [Gyalolechia ehrenbergii]